MKLLDKALLMEKNLFNFLMNKNIVAGIKVDQGL